jgi:hypothetical protein
VTGTIRRVEDFVVEHGKVEGKTKTDRVRRSKVGLGNFGGSLVGLERFIGRGLALIANSKLGEVAVVVAFPVRKLEFFSTVHVLECY